MVTANLPNPTCRARVLALRHDARTEPVLTGLPWEPVRVGSASTSTGSLSANLVGTWELVSRHTQTTDGGPVSPLPDDVVGLVAYDAGGNFSAQFMKPDDVGQPEPDRAAGSNNSRSIGGYDAYFGRYTVDDSAGTVTQTLRGSLARENVGQVLTRIMHVVDYELTIRVDTTDANGEPLILTLNWKRVG